jgi:polyphosphate kinase
VGLKTHCKLILVIRQDFSGLRRYAHVGTGNYNAETARLYTDVCLFTCDEVIGRDLTELFNYLTTGYKPKRNYLKILPSPKQCKPALLRKIEREIEHHCSGVEARIQIKTNALEDADITRALYRASREGVPIDLIVRDSCRIRPGLPGLSETVRVISVIGRFLEHSRIYYFRNGGDEEYYIGSADGMQRNLESRVEVLVPVEGADLCKELREILDSLLADTVGAWEMKSDGRYSRVEPAPGEVGESAQARMTHRAAEQYREATRLKRRGLRRKPGRRNRG